MRHSCFKWTDPLLLRVSERKGEAGILLTDKRFDCIKFKRSLFNVPLPFSKSKWVAKTQVDQSLLCKIVTPNFCPTLACQWMCGMCCTIDTFATVSRGPRGLIPCLSCVQIRSSWKRLSKHKHWRRVVGPNKLSIAPSGRHFFDIYKSGKMNHNYHLRNAQTCWGPSSPAKCNNILIRFQLFASVPLALMQPLSHVSDTTQPFSTSRMHFPSRYYGSVKPTK